METTEVREAIVELLGDESKRSRMLTNQLCDLWERWQKFKDSEQPQKFYLGLSCLKQFNAIYMKIDPNALKPTVSKVTTRKRQTANGSGR